MEHSPSSVLPRQLLALLLGSVFFALHDGERRFGVVAECDKQLRARLTKSWSELRDDRAQAQVYGRWVRLYVCRRVASDGFRCKLLESLADLVANGRELALRVRLPQQYLGARPLGVGTWIVLPQPSLSQDLLSMVDLHGRSPEVVRRPVTRCDLPSPRWTARSWQPGPCPGRRAVPARGSSAA